MALRRAIRPLLTNTDLHSRMSNSSLFAATLARSSYSSHLSFHKSRSLSSSPASPGVVVVNSEQKFNKIISKCGPYAELNTKYPNVTTYKIDIDQEAIQDTLSRLQTTFVGTVISTVKSNTRCFSTFGKVGKVFLPNHVDWRKENVLTPIKDHADAAMCTVFAVVAGVESVYNIRRGPLLDGVYNTQRGSLVELSTQHVINRFAKIIQRKNEKNGDFVDINDCGFRCLDVFDCLKIYGIPAEKDFPYKGIPNMDCDIPLPQFKYLYTIDTYQRLKPDLHTIMATLTRHPIVCAVDATTWPRRGWREDKVYCSDEHTDYTVNHCVLLVGYGVQHGMPYWLIRNSWGTTFGVGGYTKVVRGKNAFGIESELWIPILDLDSVRFMMDS